MIREITIEGMHGRVYRAVAPTGRLSRPLIEYFPHGEVDYWFELGESARKELLRATWPDYDYCAVYGTPGAEIHEIIFQGMGKRWMTLVPWNMIPVCREAHLNLQTYRWHVAWWDPLGRHLTIRTRDGLLVPTWWDLPQMEREKRRGVR